MVIRKIAVAIALCEHAFTTNFPWKLRALTRIRGVLRWDASIGCSVETFTKLPIQDGYWVFLPKFFFSEFMKICRVWNCMPLGKVSVYLYTSKHFATVTNFLGDKIAHCWKSYFSSKCLSSFLYDFWQRFNVIMLIIDYRFSSSD